MNILISCDLPNDKYGLRAFEDQNKLFSYVKTELLNLINEQITEDEKSLEPEFIPAIIALGKDTHQIRKDIEDIKDIDELNGFLVDWNECYADFLDVSFPEKYLIITDIKLSDESPEKACYEIDTYQLIVTN